MGMLRVMVVDDDKAFRDEVAASLHAMATVIGVATPIETLWTMDRTPIDVVICDMCLGTGATGADVLEVVRERWPRVVRILATGQAGDLHGAAVAAHAVLRKPCDLVALRDLLERLPSGQGDAASGWWSPRRATTRKAIMRSLSRATARRPSARITSRRS